MYMHTGSYCACEQIHVVDEHLKVLLPFDKFCD